MGFARIVVLFASGMFVLAAVGFGEDGRDLAAPPPPPPIAAPIDFGPVAGFIENRGQWAGPVRFAASARGQWLHITDRDFRCGSGGDSVAFTVAGGRGGAAVGMLPTGAVCSFFRGNDPTRHVRGIPVVAAVRRPAIAPGVDLVLRQGGGNGSAFAYDLHAAAGADVAAVELEVSGARAVHVDTHSGELVLALQNGELRQSAPIAWLQDGDERRPVACRFELRDHHRFGFVLPADAFPLPLCIDPDLRWSTTVGGTLQDMAFGVTIAANGDTFVLGSTLSTNLPVAATAFDPSYNGTNPVPFSVGDGFVARLAAANGALSWCTYLGGNENDRMVSAAAIGNEVVVTGWTSSLDYPTTAGAYDTSHNGTGDGYLYSGGDVVVTRLAANGQSLVWSTFLGGAMLEYPTSLALAPNGEVAISGHVHSLNFPTTPGAFSATRQGYSDFFVTRFAADGGSLVGSTYCGGSDGEEYPFAMTITADDDIVVAGATGSTTLPVTPGVLGPTYSGGSEHYADGYVARFDRTCSLRRWCTYLGTPANEYVRGITEHFDGSLTCSGEIDGAGLPTTPAVFGPNPFGGRDGYLWRLSGDASTTLWASYFGGTADDRFERCIDLGGGRVAACGASFSTDVPLTRGAHAPAPIGAQDAWLAVVAGDGAAVEYATAIGGPYGEWATDLARTPAGELAVAGPTWSIPFPVTPGGTPPSGGGETFVVWLAGLPLGVARHGAPSGACNRAARARARSGPFVGENTFALSCGDIPPGLPALAAIATAVLPAPLPLLGIDLWLDPATLVATLSVGVGSHGGATLPLPIPPAATLAGANLAVQFVWLDACPGLSFGASDALTIVVQP
jgi:hypothetical protein